MYTILIRILLVLIFSSVLSYAFESTTPQTSMLLEKIGNDAMVYGNGPKKVYVFVDPNCPNSQDFMTMVYESPKMRNIYQYHIYLFELKRMKSSKVIESIYASAHPLQTTFDYMINHKDVDSTTANTTTLAKVRTIDSIAQQLGINKRPYLIISKETK